MDIQVYAYGLSEYVADPVQVSVTADLALAPGAAVFDAVECLGEVPAGVGLGVVRLPLSMREGSWRFWRRAHRLPGERAGVVVEIDPPSRKLGGARPGVGLGVPRRSMPRPVSSRC